ncbi:MAG: hypothetical protein IPG81_18080 [Sandaracinaceae bacterium]|nr:hypothetical protein [Sandaracinaceae bacterium]
MGEVDIIRSVHADPQVLRPVHADALHPGEGQLGGAVLDLEEFGVVENGTVHELDRHYGVEPRELELRVARYAGGGGLRTRNHLVLERSLNADELELATITDAKGVSLGGLAPYKNTRDPDVQTRVGIARPPETPSSHQRRGGGEQQNSHQGALRRWPDHQLTTPSLGRSTHCSRSRPSTGS